MTDADEPVIPALLRAARGAYGDAIRRTLAEMGIDDLPRNGPFLLGGMGNHGLELGELVPQLRVTKQAASQLVDTLVLRGFLSREAHPEDRRRMRVELTPRGQVTAEAIRTAVSDVDEDLRRRCTPAEVAGLRAGLTALTAIREERSD
jgi:DNA-binding MarR family transcriptional regulator